jgi:hypothetical protein
LGTGREADAERCFIRALEIDPNDSLAVEKLNKMRRMKKEKI